jgi:hypothetical protein
MLAWSASLNAANAGSLSAERLWAFRVSFSNGQIETGKKQRRPQPETPWLSG